MCMHNYVLLLNATLNFPDHANHILIQSSVRGKDRMSFAHPEDNISGEHHGQA